MTIQVGFSPCPNDTFIFDAWVHQKIDTEGLVLEPILEDVEALNQRASVGELPMTKLSFHAFAHFLEHYELLDAGAALGRGVGPLLISKNNLTADEIDDAEIAIPGRMTTANLLLSIAFPNATQRVETLFSDIEKNILTEKVKAGVIIHENRFTYAEKGLKKIMDLGEFWEKTTKMPIPLGGIVVRRDLDMDLKQKINRVLARSIEFAFKNPNSSLPYVRAHAQEMSESVMYQHINLYVNDFTRNLGDEGRAAVQTLFDWTTHLEITNKNNKNIFLN